MTENALIKADEINPLEIFVTGKYQIILDSIKEKATIKNPDTSTGKGRALIKSMAAKVASSKVLLEKISKTLSDAEKKKVEDKIESIFSAKRAIVSYLEDLKKEVRKPLTDWENEKKAREEKEALEAQKLANHIEALEMNKIVTEKRSLAAERARLEQEEADRKKEDEIKKKLEKERDSEKVAILQREATAKAETERLKQEAIDKEKQAKIDQEKAVTIAKENAKKEADQKERQRLAKEADEKRIKEEKSADQTHQKRINNESLSDLLKLKSEDNQQLISNELAKQIVIAIIQGKIRNVSINY